MFRFFSILVASAFLVSVALAGGYAYDAYLSRPDDGAQAVTFAVLPDARGTDVAHDLKERGLIRSELFFRLYLRLSDVGRDLKPGSFALVPGMSFRSIAETLTTAVAAEVQVTIPEGFTLAQIGERVRAALPHVTEEEWNAAVSADSDERVGTYFKNQVKPAGVDLEGYLFPDTYRFFADATASDVVNRMVDTMGERLGNALPKDENGFGVASGLSPHEVLTLASIVEREVRDPEDMKDVADVFLKRLEMGMPLQADSTISYYLGKTSAELTVDDLRADEPFNTYTRAGLPPGPISNPGLNAIDAVLHPTENPYLFFLTTDDGTVVYASTFAEHVANKERYLRWRGDCTEKACDAH